MDPPSAGPGVHEIAGMEEETRRFVGVSDATPSPALVARDDLPPALANTLDHIVGQLSLIGKTMSVLEQRLTKTEEMVVAVTKAQQKAIGEGGGGKRK